MRANFGLWTAICLLALGVFPARAEDTGYGYRFDNEDGAPEVSGYVGLRGSFAFASQSTSNVAQGVTTKLHGSYDNGGGASVYIGTHLPYGFRLELEGLYRYLPAKMASGNGQFAVAQGDSQVAAPMINLLWDLPFPAWSLHPFVGAGVAGAYVDSALHDPTGSKTYLQTNSWAIGYQFMGGIAVPVSSESRFTAMYRWLQINNLKGGCGIPGTLVQDCRPSMNGQSIDLGLETDL